MHSRNARLLRRFAPRNDGCYTFVMMSKKVSKINRKSLTSILVFVMMAASLLFAGEVYAAERAMWVWGMSEEIVLDDPAGSRAEFFSFCEAPHGDPSKAITVIFFSGTAGGMDLIGSFPEELRGFLAAAHSRGLRVDCLDGDKSWATPTRLVEEAWVGRIKGEERCDEILAFNTGGSSDAERFDGIHYDVEPHGLRYLRGDDYDWDNDNVVIWVQYLALLESCQAKVDTYNALHTDIQFGADIAWWYDVDEHPGVPRDVQARIDYVGIMDYRETGENIVSGANTEIVNGNILQKEVFIGVETMPASPPDPETITFYEEGNTYMEEQLTYVNSVFASHPSFAGIAVHYYEDVDAREEAYRSLWTTTFPGFRPVVEVTFPNGNEGIELAPGTNYEITWTARDEDDAPNTLDITIQYSSNGGQSWNPLASGETNDGTYTWNTTGYSDGTEYRIKITATDPIALTGYDVSDYDFAFSDTPESVPEWSSLPTGEDTNQEGLMPTIIPDGDVLHFIYYRNWGGTRGVYYKKSTDNGSSWESMVALAEGNTISPRKPALAVNGDILAAVWVEDEASAGDGKKVKVRISTDGGDNWGDEEEIQGSATGWKQAEFPDITIDSSDNIHVVWGVRLTADPNPWYIYYNYKASGGGWADRVRISATSSAHVRAAPAVTSDSNGIHVVWGEFNWSGGWKYKIQYRKKSGSWALIKQIAQSTVTNDVWNNYFPDICSDGSNKLHVVWQTAGDSAQTDTPPITSDIYYSSSTDAGANWSSPINLGDGYVPRIAEAGGELRLIYYQPMVYHSGTESTEGDLKYRKSSDGGANWSTEDTITDDAREPYYNIDASVLLGFPCLASDSLGNMVAGWRGYSTNHIMFSYKGTFSPPSNLFVDLVRSSSEALRLKWGKPSGYTPNSYSLYRSVNNQPYSLAAANIYNVKYMDTGLSETSYYKYKVTATEGAAESITSNISNALYPGGDFLVDYFEGYEGTAYNKVGASDLTWAYDTSVTKEGAQSMQIDYTYSGSGWGAVLGGSFPLEYDVLPYGLVKFWAKGGAVDGAAIKFQFTEAGRAEGNEIWESPATTISNTDWAEYQFNFSDFVKVDSIGGDGNWRMDTRSIGAYGLGFGPETANGTYYVDALRFLTGVGEISIPQASYTFQPDPIVGNIDNHRFVLGPIPVQFGGFYSPWTIRIWTNNGEGADLAGLVGVTDPGQVIPLKVWCVNYGPAETVPDEENNYFYSGYDFGDGVNIGRQHQNGSKEDIYTSGTFDENYWGFDINGNGIIDEEPIAASPANKIGEEPSWLRIPEDDEMSVMNRYTWRRLAWAPGGELGEPVPGNPLLQEFDIYLAIDVQGKRNQQYTTTTLTVEYINE